MRRLVVVVLVAVLAGACGGQASELTLAPTTTGAGATTETTASTTTTEPPAPVDGAAGVGDPYFPELGNGGYNVDHYDLHLAWYPDEQPVRLDGLATLTLTPTVPLRRFNLDLEPFTVTAVTVDGDAAAFTHDGDHELTITPEEPLRRATAVAVAVAYTGTPTPVGTGTDVFDVGWNTDGRDAFVASEPAGAATFFPGNDHPTDKATFAFEIDVPADLTAVANGTGGRVDDPAVGDGRATFAYEMTDPMATYLASLAIGDLVLDESTGPTGVAIRNAYPRRLAEAATVDFAATGDIIAVFEDWFGPYPFDVYGQVVVDEPLGFALENQTLSLFGSDFITGTADFDDFIAHELAHQWFGDAVSPASWREIWLNEGFATFAEWIWRQETGARTIARSAEIAHGGADYGVAPGDPGASELFHASPYIRGGLALYALYDRLGEDDFRTLLRHWVGRNGGRHASTEDLIELASQIAGEPMDELIERWVYDTALPPLP